MAIETPRHMSFERNMLLVFSLLISFVAATIAQASPQLQVECDIVPVTECPVTCGGGWQLMKYACVEKTDNCACPKNPIKYQCNNRPCLGKDATLIDKYYDEDNKQQQENGVEYVEDSAENVPIKKAQP